MNFMSFLKIRFNFLVLIKIILRQCMFFFNFDCKYVKMNNFRF